MALALQPSPKTLSPRATSPRSLASTSEPTYSVPTASAQPSRSASASSPDGAVAEVEVERCRCDEQRSPPNAPVAQVRAEAKQPDTDAKAHTGYRMTVCLEVWIQSFHASGQV